MTSHTPGPWRTGEDGHNILSAQPGERPKMLASVYHDLGGVGGLTSKEHAEAHANARLMAAAPDLLAACRAVDEWYDLVRQDYPEMLAPYQAVQAAIAKAEGPSEVTPCN